ncbi:MAG: hypothetical protein EOO38_30270, partial [Cytophagaceae bacterium]
MAAPNWRAFVDLSATAGKPQLQTQLVQFFDRLSKTAMGQHLLSMVEQRGKISVTFRGSSRAGYDGQSHSISIPDNEFSSEAGRDYIGTMLHELTHHLYQNHYDFAPQKAVEGLAGQVLALARSKGLTKAQYEQIVAPFAAIDNYEQAAVNFSRFLQRELFGNTVSSLDYYARPFDIPANGNTFNYDTPVTATTQAQVEAFNSAIARVAQLNGLTPLNDLRSAQTAIGQVLDGARAAGLMTPSYVQQLKTFYGE